VAGVGLFVAGLPAVAQDPAPRGVTERYEGVVPGSGHEPPLNGAARRQRRDGAAILSWVGFQAMEDGGSRFFLQLSREVPYQGQSSEGRFEVLLPNTRVHLRNTLRPLETRFFDTPVRSADAKRRGRDMVVIFELRAEVAPRLSSAEGQNGYRFVYVDWPEGDYAPREEPGAGAPASDDEGEGSTSIRVYQGGR
jgi:hypothetical protein